VTRVESLLLPGGRGGEGA